MWSLIGFYHVKYQLFDTKPPFGYLAAKEQKPFPSIYMCITFGLCRSCTGCESARAHRAKCQPASRILSEKKPSFNPTETIGLWIISNHLAMSVFFSPVRWHVCRNPISSKLVHRPAIPSKYFRPAVAPPSGSVLLNLQTHRWTGVYWNKADFSK